MLLDSWEPRKKCNRVLLADKYHKCSNIYKERLDGTDPSRTLLHMVMLTPAHGLLMANLTSVYDDRCLHASHVALFGI